MVDEAKAATLDGDEDLERLSRRLGRYEVLTEIASGGMASVYLARAHGAGGFERTVAIKLCHPHLRRDDDFVTMFLDEAQLAARIHHPNVVATLDVANEDLLYLVMEYVEGDRLSGLFRAAAKKKSPLPTGIVIRILSDALAGLHAAHELKDDEGSALEIVHRDVSPQNILVGTDGLSRITDFGIAKAAARATVTRTGQVKGKPSYMAPEQLTGAPVDRRADVFAAGIVCWEALTGKRLFDADTDAAVIQRVLSLEIDPPSKHHDGLNPEIDAAVMRSLERVPEKRWSTAADFAAALESTPCEVATHRMVAEAVQALVGESLSERKKLVRDARKRADGDTRTPAPTPRGSDEVATRAHTPARSGTRKSARIDVPDEVQRATVPSPRPRGRLAPAVGGGNASTPSDDADDDSRGARPAVEASRRTGGATSIVIALALLVGAGGVVFALTRGGSSASGVRSGSGTGAPGSATETSTARTNGGGVANGPTDHAAGLQGDSAVNAGAAGTDSASTGAARTDASSAASGGLANDAGAVNSPSVGQDASTVSATRGDAATSPAAQPRRRRGTHGGGGGGGNEYEPTGI